MLPTVKSYFDNDAKALNATQNISIKNTDGLIVDISIKLSYKFEEKIKYFSIFFPDNSDFNAIRFVLSKEDIINGVIDKNEKLQTVGFLDTPESENLSNFIYIKKIFLYIDATLSSKEKASILEYTKEMGLIATIRDRGYANECARLSKPRAFISHDSRDKALLVKPLANDLILSNCPVWYDDFTLKPGDNLSDKIDEGIKNAPHCILILSKNFIGNKRWAKSEADSIFSKEIHEKRNIIIPVWYDVSSEDVYKFNAKLINRKGIIYSGDIKKVTREILSVISL